MALMRYVCRNPGHHLILLCPCYCYMKGHTARGLSAEHVYVNKKPSMTCKALWPKGIRNEAHTPVLHSSDVLCAKCYLVHLP